jgi:hypothetical protein
MDDPNHWRNRAEEARVQADQLNEPQARKIMLDAAADYDRLAQRAYKRLRDLREPKNGASITET